MRGYPDRWTKSRAAGLHASGSEQDEQDALTYGLRLRIDPFAYQCSKFGVQPDEKECLAGWQVGDWERSIRVSGSDCCASR